MITARDVALELVRVHRYFGWRAEKEALFSPRRIDVLVIAPGGSDVVAFEIKVSLADFRTELKHPEKRQAVIANCTQFYFVSPSGLIPPREVPDGCGLMYFDGSEFTTVKPLQGRSSLLCRIEQDRIDEREDRDRRNRLPEWLYYLEEYGEEYTADCYCGPSDSFGEVLPKWMRRDEPLRKPLRLDLDVETAVKSAPHHQCVMYSSLTRCRFELVQAVARPSQ